MISTSLQTESGFRWVDCVDPSPEELKSLAETFALHHTSIADCMDPVHLPKFEQFEDTLFFILRHVDLENYLVKKYDTIQELTRKLAVFLGENFLITVHRKPQNFISKVLTKAQKVPESPELSRQILLDLVRQVLLTYERPLDHGEEAFEELELRVLDNKAEPLLLEELYFMKRRAAIYKKLVRQNMDVIFKLNAGLGTSAPISQDLREEGERVYYHADELVEDISNLLNTHISISSHRTNEIVRVLTLFSVFFMPLTFIVGVYGMNFDYMPELHSHYGYLSVWALMVAISSAIYFWFRRRGWLK